MPSITGNGFDQLIGRLFAAGFRTIPTAKFQLHGVNSIAPMTAVGLDDVTAGKPRLLPAIKRIGVHCPALLLQQPKQRIRANMRLVTKPGFQSGHRESVFLCLEKP